MKIKRFNRLISCSLLASFLFTIPLFGHQATGKSGMVVTAHPVASELGVEILQAGGNAVDAAVGAALAVGVIEPYGSGLGGGGAMLIYLREPDSLTFINYYQCALQNAPADFQSRDESSSARAVLVPRTAAGLYHALTNYGTISWEVILNKVIQKVEHGYEANEIFHNTMLFENGGLVMVVGSPGGGQIISTLVQVICNVIDFKKDAETANCAPRFHSRRWNEKIPVEGRFTNELLADDLENPGYLCKR
jgi:gamma-glutamyltranspeptidase